MVFFFFAHIAWSVWKEHNNIIFRDKEALENIVFKRIYMLNMENINCIPCNEEKMEIVVCIGHDLKMAKEWHTKSDVSNASKHGKRNCEGVFWIHPLGGWIKDNFGGADKGNLGLAGSGVVLRDHNGNFILVVELFLGS